MGKNNIRRPIIIFDLDGTLADTMRDLLPAVNRTIARLGIAPAHAHQIRETSGQGLKAMIECGFALENQQISPVLLDELFEICLADYRENLCVHTQLFPGVINCLQDLADQNWQLAVCTNKPIELAKNLLEELGHLHRFDSVTGGDSFTFRKPDPRHLFSTIEEAGGQCELAVMVGDTQNDIASAQNAGMPVIAVDFGYSRQPVSTFNPDVVISHFDELLPAAQQLIAKN